MDSIKSLKTDLTISFNTQLQALKEEFSAKIEELNTQLIDLDKNNGNSNFEEIINEVNERQLRANNVIIFGVNEQEGNVEEKRLKDFDMSSKILNTISPDEPVHILRSFRIGKPNNNSRPRPLKVVLSDQSEAKRILRLKKNLINSQYSTIAIKDDRTIKQREYLKSLQDEIRRRTNNGESNLTIKYIRSVPNIISTVSKN